MEELIRKALAWLKSAPKWCRVAIPFLLAALCAAYLFSSCGVVSRVQLDKRTTREVRDTTHLIVTRSTIRTRTRSYGIRSVLDQSRSYPHNRTDNDFARCVLTP